jgi:imidazolonepropionase-like amidohydrolase
MTTLIENVRVLEGTALGAPRTVAFEETILEAPPVGTGDPDEVIDGAGRTLLPGLIDAHMHVLGHEDLDALARWGVTTGLDMAAWPAEMVDALRSARGTAHLTSALTPAVGPGGNHARMPGFPAEGILTDASQAAGFVARRAAEGADYIKIVTEAAPPEGMDLPTVRAIVREAHERGLQVVAHSVTVGAFHLAVEAGVDVSTHAPLDAALDAETVARMREQGMISVPTLTMMEGIARLRADQGLRLEYAIDSVAALHEAGVPVLVGTDANSAPGAPFAPRHGESVPHELALLARAAMTQGEILAGATSRTAEVFGLSDRGAVEPGLRADLLLVDGDPTTDLAAVRRIEGVWIDGVRFDGARAS